VRSALTLLALGIVSTSAIGEVERYELENGAVVILDPVEGVGSVAVIAAYDTGSSDDPAGAPQAAHLAEHLRCTSATASWDTGVSYARLNELGGANAETLAGFTYYDYVLPPKHLELALRVESERLGSLEITPADIAREGPRAAGELTGLDASPGRYVGKFALAGVTQGWTHNAAHVNLQTALGEMPIGSLRQILERHTTTNLTLIVAGDFELEHARQLIDATIGALQEGEAPLEPVAIDWATQPATRRMTWDARTRVVVVACPAPEDQATRAVLTGLGQIAHMTCNSIEGVLSLHTSGQTAPVGEAPFHVLAAINDDADPDRVIEAIHDRLDALASSAPLYKTQLLGLLREPPRPDVDQLRAQVAALARMRSMSEQRAMGLAIGNMALQTLMRERMGGEQARHAISTMSADQLRQAAANALSRDKRRVTILKPHGQGP